MAKPNTFKPICCVRNIFVTSTLIVLQGIADRLLLRHGLASSPTSFKRRLVQVRASLCYVLVHVNPAHFAEEVGRQWRERLGCSQQPSGSLRITGIRGLSTAQKASLRALGAFEDTSVGG